ncbi:MAG: sigma-70 family RNA polymerase sigma factor [Phycisphaerales bacterium]|nr:MAG: sigma-70 family RNA polymerase sigma factor [Phycisphaerales bacterium]
MTQLLLQAGEGDQRATDLLLTLVYDELRRLAGGMMRCERPDHTLQGTALVHEAYLKLIDQTRAQWQNRAHFFAVAAQAIRRVLVDHARGHRRHKRGGERAKLVLDEGLAASYQQEIDLIALDEALLKLAERNQQQARIVEMRFFAGLTIEETASVVGVSPSTVEREWRYARAWLHRVLSAE